MKIKKGLKTTAIVICDKYGEAKFAYIVSSKEIDDVAMISNKETFAKFEDTLLLLLFINWFNIKEELFIFVLLFFLSF